MATLGGGEVDYGSQESINVPEILLQGQDNRIVPELPLQGQDHPAESSQPNHGKHDAIFCLMKKCSGCDNTKPGTCFLMSNLNEADSEYFHFVTCAHMLYCFPCGEYMHLSPSVRIAENHHEPMVPELWQFSEPGDDWGWVRVPEAYKRKKAYVHDYGVLAVKKAKLLPKFGRKMKAAMDNMVHVNPKSAADFYPRGFLCGYKTRTQLYCSAHGKDAPKPRRKKAKNAQLRKAKRVKERTACGLYLTKQDHFERDAKHMKWEQSGSLLGKRLLRHYMDSSGGQSGSPIRVPSGKAVGIHCGYRGSSSDVPRATANAEAEAQYHGCNVAVHLLDSGVLVEMETWVKDGGKRTDSSSAVAGSSPEGGVDEVESKGDDVGVQDRASLRDCGSSSNDEEEEEEEEEEEDEKEEEEEKDKQSEDVQLEPAAKVPRIS